jgi:hypothetical protein
VNGSFIGGLGILIGNMPGLIFWPDIVQHMIEEEGGASFQNAVAPARARLAVLQSSAAQPEKARPVPPLAAFSSPAGALHDFSELAISDGQSCQVQGSGCA